MGKYLDFVDDSILDELIEDLSRDDEYWYEKFIGNLNRI